MAEFNSASFSASMRAHLSSNAIFPDSLPKERKSTTFSRFSKVTAPPAKNSALESA